MVYTRPKAVTHPSTNRARRRATSFMRRTTLTTTPRRQLWQGIEWFTETHAWSVSEVETGQSAQSSAFAVLDEPALRSEARRVRKQVLVATDAVQVRLTVRLYTSHTTAAQPSHCSDHYTGWRTEKKCQKDAKYFTRYCSDMFTVWRDL